MTGITPAQEAMFVKMLNDYFKMFDGVENAYANDEAKKEKWYGEFIETVGAEKASAVLAAYERRKRGK